MKELQKPVKVFILIAAVIISGIAWGTGGIYLSEEFLFVTPAVRPISLMISLFVGAAVSTWAYAMVHS